MNLFQPAVSLYGMNKSIQELRDIAAAKRDNLIKAAKAEYSETCKRIGELETRLRSKPRRRGARSNRIRLVDVIYDNLPTDRAFGFADVEGIIEAKGKSYAKSSINMTISRMLKAGDIKRVQFAKLGKPALFALPHVEIEAAKTMLDWAREVDGWQGLEPVEIMVRMVENGYEMDAPPNDSVKSLERQLELNA